MVKIREHKLKKERKQREKAAQDKKRRLLVGICAVCVYTYVVCVYTYVVCSLCIHIRSVQSVYTHTFCAVCVYTYVVC